jgi:DnaK suppressor protein
MVRNTVMEENRRQELAQLREEYARQLREERQTLLQEVAAGEADLRSMESERASELEERAQEARATRVFARLDDRRKQRIEEIDQVLQRIALGTYGICARCGKPIPIARLRALPTARVHVQCPDGEEHSDEDERGPPITTEEEEPLLVGEAEELIAAGQEEEALEEVEVEARTERMASEISTFTDEELEEYIREQLTEDGRVDLDEIQITCRSGVITLDGALPSEEQHQILLQYVTDFAGIQEVVDRLVINELLWEREDRTDVPEDEEPSPGSLSGAMEDMIDSDQENGDYAPPVGPVQERT